MAENVEPAPELEQIAMPDSAVHPAPRSMHIPAVPGVQLPTLGELLHADKAIRQSASAAFFIDYPV